jgi:hypothetical protein
MHERREAEFGQAVEGGKDTFRMCYLQHFSYKRWFTENLKM